MKNFISIYIARRKILRKAWRNLPQELRVDNQVVGRHWSHCGYTLGPAYCSFGCSHCYLPKSANRQPLVELHEMKKQIDANLELLGPGGALQITGGDVIDAYWRAGCADKLVELIRYSVDAGLVPMLMTHGQKLLEHPDYLERLVVDGGLRKLSIHIDSTMLGNDGYRNKNVSHEAQLNPLRDQFTRLILNLRKKTGIRVHAAQTVTVTENNIDSIHEIIHWLISKPDNMKVCRTLSFQTEAAVGRTRSSTHPVTPDAVWKRICDAVKTDLPRDHLVFGHAECSSTTTCIVTNRETTVIPLSGHGVRYRRFWSSVLKTFSGLSASGRPGYASVLTKCFSVLLHPRIILDAVRFIWVLLKERRLSVRVLFECIRGRAQGFNIVMHNFIPASEIVGIQTAQTQARLHACSFKGAVEIDGQWKAVSMCEMNAQVRPSLYSGRKSVGQLDGSSIVANDA